MIMRDNGNSNNWYWLMEWIRKNERCVKGEKVKMRVKECEKGWWWVYGMGKKGGEKERNEREGEKGRFKLDDCLSIVYTKAYYR